MAQIYRFTSDPVALNSYLVLGSERGLVIDTGAGPAQAARILSAFRSLTDLPLCAVNTHDHWDHFFGNAHMRAHGVGPFYGSEAFARDSPGSAWVQFDQVPLADEPDLPSDPGALAVEVTALDCDDTIDLGGVEVSTMELAGHTESDLVLWTEDVLFTGDLVEEGAAPQIGEDATPARWASALREVLLVDDIALYLPGHGRGVCRGFVQEQAAHLAEIAADPSVDPREFSAAEGSDPATRLASLTRIR